jgi:hypothetical protein
MVRSAGRRGLEQLDSCARDDELPADLLGWQLPGLDELPHTVG